MAPQLAAFLLMFWATVQGGSSVSGTGNKGSCPQPPKPAATITKRASPAPPVPGVHYLGAVIMLVSLSDTGSICEVEVVKGIDEAMDKQAVSAIRQQLFQPIGQDGKPIPGFMTIRRDFWRGDTSDTLVSLNADDSKGEVPDAESFPAADVPSLIAAGKVDGKTYWNEYFGLSFSAPGATLTAPSTVDEQGRNVRLVDAVAGAHKREDMYTISILADRLPNYPQLLSRSEYVTTITAQLQREGAKTTRDNFQCVISGVEFVGSILQESDGPSASHFRGIFSTVMKGYFLSLDVAATSEERVLEIASSIDFKHDQ
jgi:Gram-negative bacterial TonB protein C-terminal